MDVEQYVNDNMMLSLVNSDGASDTIIKTYLMGPGPAVLCSLETSGYRPTLTICPAQTIILAFIPTDSYVREFDSDMDET